MDDHREFARSCEAEVRAQGADPELRAATAEWMRLSQPHRYSYHFEWLGRPVIQHPQDILAIQQLIWQIQPDLVIETGVARGGSLVLSASLLELVAQCGGPPEARVLGIDIDIRPHNRAAIEAHPMARRIDLLQGSSTAPAIVDEVHRRAATADRVLVLLDSNHTHDHVLAELSAYAPLVSEGSYCVVFDTIIADMPDGTYPDRDWTRTANPRTAIKAFQARCEVDDVRDAAGQSARFEIDHHMEARLLITVAPGGFLRRLPEGGA